MKIRFTGTWSDNVVPGILLAVFLAATWMSIGFSAKARLAPLFICLCCVVFVAADLVIQNVSIVRPQRSDPIRQHPGHVPADDGVTEQLMAAELALEEKSSGPIKHSSINAILVMLLPFFVAVLLTGLVPGAILFVFGYLVLVAKAGLKLAVFYAVLTYAVIELLFVKLLGVFMYFGIFGLQIPYVSG